MDPCLSKLSFGFADVTCGKAAFMPLIGQPWLVPPLL